MSDEDIMLRRLVSDPAHLQQQQVAGQATLRTQVSGGDELDSSNGSTQVALFFLSREHPSIYIYRDHNIYIYIVIHLAAAATLLIGDVLILDWALSLEVLKRYQ